MCLKLVEYEVLLDLVPEPVPLLAVLKEDIASYHRVLFIIGFQLGRGGGRGRRGREGGEGRGEGEGGEGWGEERRGGKGRREKG